MDLIVWLGIIAAGLVALLAVGYVIWPLLQPGPTLPLIDDSRLTELLVRKDILLRSIKDLEMDRQMGKISEEDYRRFTERLRRQAITVMTQIDTASPAGSAQDTALEAEIARLRKVQSAESHATPPVSASAPVATSAAQPAAPAAATRFCTQCGEPVAREHKFCSACGARVTGANGDTVTNPVAQTTSSETVSETVTETVSESAARKTAAP